MTIKIRGRKVKKYINKFSSDLRTREGKLKQKLLSKITFPYKWEDAYSDNWISHERNKKKENAIKYIIKEYNILPRKDGMYLNREIEKYIDFSIGPISECWYEATSIIKKIVKKRNIERKYNKPKKVGYKVVRVKNSKCFKPATELALQKIEYRLNKETCRFGHEKEYGGFAVFQTLEKAMKWSKNYGEKILKIEYIESNDGLWKKSPPSYRKGYDGYYAQSNGINYFEGQYPEGTIIADYVKPIEIII